MRAGDVPVQGKHNDSSWSRTHTHLTQHTDQRTEMKHWEAEKKFVFFERGTAVVAAGIELIIEGIWKIY